MVRTQPVSHVCKMSCLGGIMHRQQSALKP